MFETWKLGTYELGLIEIAIYEVIVAQKLQDELGDVLRQLRGGYVLFENYFLRGSLDPLIAEIQGHENLNAM